MSNSVFPTLQGLTFEVGRFPNFKTKIAAAVSGSEQRAAFQADPLWQFSLEFEFLRDDATNNELNKILTLFLAVRGQFDSFLFLDPDAFQVTDLLFGTTDGTTTQYQLVRTITDGSLSFSERVQNVKTLTNIKRNGSPLATPADYTINSTGLVTLVAAGSAGQSLTWTGQYYNRVRFMMDAAQTKKFMDKLWTFGSCDLWGSPSNKVI
ncbi:MAG TPA: DUF2460 domain-containing protein [Burkholderiales bacterium]|nr:DUF2460 domain-containing protein [Burkholderiales bacterium]